MKSRGRVSTIRIAPGTQASSHTPASQTLLGARILGSVPSPQARVEHHAGVAIAETDELQLLDHRGIGNGGNQPRTHRREGNRDGLIGADLPAAAAEEIEFGVAPKLHAPLAWMMAGFRSHPATAVTDGDEVSMGLGFGPGQNPLHGGRIGLPQKFGPLADVRFFGYGSPYLTLP